MNGYKSLADGYRQMAENGKISHEEAEKKARIYDFLATCDENDFYTMFDSTAFNTISKSYLRVAVRNLERRGVIEDEQGEAIRREYNFCFSEMTAEEAEINSFFD